MSNIIITKERFQKIKKKHLVVLNELLSSKLLKEAENHSLPLLQLKLSDSAQLLAKSFNFSNEHELQAMFDKPLNSIPNIKLSNKSVSAVALTPLDVMIRQQLAVGRGFITISTSKENYVSKALTSAQPLVQASLNLYGSSGTLELIDFNESQGAAIACGNAKLI